MGASPLDDTPEDQIPEPTEPVTAEQLRTLRAIILSRMDAGADVADLSERFRADLASFSQGKSHVEVEQALNSQAA